MVNIFGIFWDSHVVGADDREACPPHLLSEAFPSAMHASKTNCATSFRRGPGRRRMLPDNSGLRLAAAKCVEAAVRNIG
jgi:hypothetical protein